MPVPGQPGLGPRVATIVQSFGSGPVKDASVERSMVSVEAPLLVRTTPPVPLKVPGTTPP